ncbi:unnamed protein product [Orchesella dallaii]|uniref:Uncharacterized protein n=1 Tax=Orchesella dallaii TaxID=48710 RepID=A0ABP1QH75_9HEXA
MGCCCPCSRRSRALVVGIADLIVGSGGLSAVCFLLFIISDEMKKLEDRSPIEYDERMHILTGLYWSVMLSYVFPATVTLLTGIFTVFAVSQNNDCCAIASILLTIILVFAGAGILLILYLIGIEYPFLIPLGIGTMLHVIFTFILLSFRANDLKAQGTV